MCGIAGEINYNSNCQIGDEAYYEMKRLLKPRGPNQDGIYKSENATLIHTRLSVVDLENGIQPMIVKLEDKEYSMVYNGELYNTEELRKTLIESGHRFSGHSDTEVLLKAFIQWGTACVNKLNGIFAFSIWDKYNQRLFIARDRMGVKPFFYHASNGMLVFASEPKALLAHPKISASIDKTGISELLLIAPGRTPGCGVFKDIDELKAGHCGYFSRDGLHIYEYWKLEDKPHTDSFAQTSEKVRELVLDSITRQLVSDVPVCTFLSGGLDSSIISAVASKFFKDKGKQLDTYSVDYKENAKYFKASKFQPNNDDYYIDCMSKSLLSTHHKITLETQELVDALYSAVDARDLPGMADVDSSLLLFCGEVKKNATVALSGECADEIFGGYPWFRDETIRAIDGFPWSQSTEYRYSFLREEFASKINPTQYVQERYRNTINSASKINNLSPLESRMKEMMHLNIDWFMQTLLDRKDRMSMYNGLEVRVPFCDYRIVEYAYSIPWEMKDYQGREKGLLRHAMQGLLPDEVLWRKKSPYPKTHHPEYLNSVSSLLKNIIEDKNSPLLSIVKKSELEKLLTSDNSIPWYGQLMTTPQTIAYFIQLNYWLEKFKVSIII